MLRRNTQKMESMKTKDVSSWIEDDATPRSPVRSISIEISPEAIQCGVHVANLDAEDIGKGVNLIAARRTEKNPRKWVVKKRGSQVCDLNQLKLKTVVLHDDRDD